VLVLAAILFTCCGFLPPLIQWVRESNYRNGVRNNQKHLIIAAQTFNDSYFHLPGPTSEFAVLNPKLKPGDTGYYAGVTDAHLGVWFQLLPYFEQQALYNQIRSTTAGNLDTTFVPARQTVLKVLVQHNDASNPGHLTTPGKYLGANAGVGTDVLPISGLFAPNARTATFGTTSYGYNPLIFNGDAAVGRMQDGTSNTIMFAERLQVCGGVANVWLGAPTASLLAPPSADPKRVVSPVGYRASFIPGFNFTEAGEFAGANFVPGNLGVHPQRCDPRAPSSPHSRGIIVGFADGSVRIITAGAATAGITKPGNADRYNGLPTGNLGWPPPDIPPVLNADRRTVWSALMTPNGREEFVLD
jgi:prepilin-type processing-associated H-X9-DG protein